MRPVFNSAGWLGHKLPSLLLGCLLAVPWFAGAQQATYISPPIVPVPPSLYPPNVNATTFINAGVWNISSAALNIPYETASTLNYTNSGTMNCAIGWEFDYGPYPSGVRSWSANFLNNNVGTISALDTFANTIFVGGITSVGGVSELLISATNIVNQGLLTVGSYGKMVLNGSGVNLSRSGLEVTPITEVGSSTIKTNFTPDTAIYDEYWLGTPNQFYWNGSPWSGTEIYQASFVNVGIPCGTADETIGPLIPQASDSYVTGVNPGMLVTTNLDGTVNPPVTIYSNIVKQAVFAYASDPAITPSVLFGPSLGPTNYFLPMAAQFITYATNMVTKQLQASTIYVVDDLAAVGTNGMLFQNSYRNSGGICTAPTYRPNSVVVQRSEPNEYANGSSGFGTPPADFFYFSGIETNTYTVPPPTNYTYYSNYYVIGKGDAYSALVDNLAAEPPAGFSITNAPGRIEVYAKDIDLTKVRMSAAGLIKIQASNLISSAGATMDCQNLSYNLGSTNGLLNITNLAGQSVQRLHGTVSEWSMVWTNYLIQVYQNYVTNSAATNAPFFSRSDITNVTEVDLAITVVDGGSLLTTVPVSVLNLTLHSTNMIVSDTMNVANTLLFDGQSLTINGGLVLDPINLPTWSSVIAPTLRYFTNNGDLQIANSAHFGSDGATNYAVFANNGTITAGSETINSGVFLSGGSQTALAGYYATMVSGKVENGSISSGQGAQFAATTLKLNQATITAGDQLYFYVTGSLFDAGGGSGNILTCNNGFDLAVKPTTGDLLGTALETITPTFASVSHYWSGLDKGVSSAGYTNNEAVGQLILNEGAGSQFVFHATGVTNAIYVDLLDLSQCPDFLDPSVLTIDPNFVIYYAATKLPSSFTVPPNTNGIPQEPEEFLNGQLGGHLVWVNSFAGPNSSVDVLINGQTVQVNKALRYSKIIDSNGNGIANYYDSNPFNLPPAVLFGSMATNNPPPGNKFAISWTAAANTVYQVQYSTNIAPAVWTPLLSYTNSAPNSVGVTVWDTNALARQRFYRVSHP